jgi:hypothetical protein
VRDAAIPRQPLAELWLAKLYRSLSRNLAEAGVQVLGEWFDSGDRERIQTAARFVQETHGDFVFDHVEFVVTALERAEAIGQECLDHVTSCFCISATCGSRSGVAGQPFPRDLSLRDRSTAELANHAPGTPAHRLFERILHRAQRNIRDSLLEAEEREE